MREEILIESNLLALSSISKQRRKNKSIAIGKSKATAKDFKR